MRLSIGLLRKASTARSLFHRRVSIQVAYSSGVHADRAGADGVKRRKSERAGQGRRITDCPLSTVFRDRLGTDPLCPKPAKRQPVRAKLQGNVAHDLQGLAWHHPRHERHIGLMRIGTTTTHRGRPRNNQNAALGGDDP